MNESIRKFREKHDETIKAVLVVAGLLLVASELKNNRLGSRLMQDDIARRKEFDKLWKKHIGG